MPMQRHAAGWVRFELLGAHPPRTSRTYHSKPDPLLSGEDLLAEVLEIERRAWDLRERRLLREYLFDL